MAESRELNEVIRSPPFSLSWHHFQPSTDFIFSISLHVGKGGHWPLQGYILLTGSPKWRNSLFYCSFTKSHGRASVGRLRGHRPVPEPLAAISEWPGLSPVPTLSREGPVIKWCGYHTNSNMCLGCSGGTYYPTLFKNLSSLRKKKTLYHSAYISHSSYITLLSFCPQVFFVYILSPHRDCTLLQESWFLFILYAFLSRLLLLTYLFFLRKFYWIPIAYCARAMFGALDSMKFSFRSLQNPATLCLLTFI